MAHRPSRHQHSKHFKIDAVELSLKNYITTRAIADDLDFCSNAFYAGNTSMTHPMSRFFREPAISIIHRPKKYVNCSVSCVWSPKNVKS